MRRLGLEQYHFCHLNIKGIISVKEIYSHTSPSDKEHTLNNNFLSIQEMISFVSLILHALKKLYISISRGE